MRGGPLVLFIWHKIRGTAAVILILIAYGPFVFYGMPPTLDAPAIKVF